MPVVTTRPCALAASAGRTPGKGLNPLQSAVEILFVQLFVLVNTFSMFSRRLQALKYVTGSGARGGSGAGARPRPATRVAHEAGV